MTHDNRHVSNRGYRVRMAQVWASCPGREKRRLIDVMSLGLAGLTDRRPGRLLSSFARTLVSTERLALFLDQGDLFRMSNRITLLALAYLAVGPLACSKPTKSERSKAEVAPAQAAPSAVLAPSDPATLFKSKCVVCHGDAGKGDGPGAAALTPKPRAFRDAAWQAKVSDEDIAKIILEGGPAVGKSPAMPPNPDLKDKPEVVAGLVKLIRNFK